MKHKYDGQYPLLAQTGIICVLPGCLLGILGGGCGFLWLLGLNLNSSLPNLWCLMGMFILAEVGALSGGVVGYYIWMKCLSFYVRREVLEEFHQQNLKFHVPIITPALLWVDQLAMRTSESRNH